MSTLCLQGRGKGVSGFSGSRTGLGSPPEATRWARGPETPVTQQQGRGWGRGCVGLDKQHQQMSALVGASCPQQSRTIRLL